MAIDTPAEAARKFHRLANDIPNMHQKVLTASALTLKKSVQGTLKVAAPRGRLNVGKRGAKVGVRYDTQGPRRAVVRMTGPAHLLENPTKAHRIPKETVGRGSRKRANKKQIYIPGVGVRASANHRGTKGKQPWAKGIRAGIPHLDTVGGKILKDTMRQVFR